MNAMNVERRNALVVENLALVEWIYHHYRIPLRLHHHEFDDVIQVIRLAIIKAAEIYDDSKGKFSSLAVRLAHNELVRLRGEDLLISIPSWLFSPGKRREHYVAKYVGNVRRSQGVRCVGEANWQLDKVQQNHFAELERDEECVIYLSRVREELTARDWRLLEMSYLLGLPQDTIGEELGLTQQGVAVARRSALKKARTALGLPPDA